MHIEILTEDSSSQRLLEHLLPKLIGPLGDPHTWRLHPYRGMGRIPAGLSATSDPSKRILLTELPRLLRGNVNTPRVDAVVVVLDTDRRDCVAFLAELKALAASCNASHLVMFRLAIEEIEAWYFGDRAALQQAYPKARMRGSGRLCAGLRVRHLGNHGRSHTRWRRTRRQASRMAPAGPAQA